MTNHVAVPQVPTLVVLDETINAPVVRVPQVPTLMVGDGPSNPRISQLPILVVYNEGSREDFSLRAWSFFLDGNWFYVLHLGLEGTWVYHVEADQWYEWQTAGYDNWNAEQGLVWNGWIVAGDNQNGILWSVDPEELEDDDFRPITRVVTSIMNCDDRQTVVVDGLWIYASVGFPTSPDPLVNFSFSDDQGVTYVDMVDCNVTLSAGDYTQEIAFRSLGSFQAPGRVFRITDVGAAVRIDRAYIETH